MMMSIYTLLLCICRAFPFHVCPPTTTFTLDHITYVIFTFVILSLFPPFFHHLSVCIFLDLVLSVTRSHTIAFIFFTECDMALAETTRFTMSSVHDVSKLGKKNCFTSISVATVNLVPSSSTGVRRISLRPPAEPENDSRSIRLLEVENHAKLGKDNLWAIRDKVRDIILLEA